jgi:hypothetical protein
MMQNISFSSSSLSDSFNSQDLSSSLNSSSSSDGQKSVRFEIGRKIGRGGMGSVFLVCTLKSLCDTQILTEIQHRHMTQKQMNK